MLEPLKKSENTALKAQWEQRDGDMPLILLSWKSGAPDPALGSVGSFLEEGP